MDSEWPHSVQDTAHSIQNAYNEPGSSHDEEGTPLLNSRQSPCVRNMWITLLAIFLCVGFAAGAYLLLIEELERPISQNYNYTLITRSEWQAKKVASDIPTLQVPVKRVLLTKTNSPECTKDDCSPEIHKVQSDHLKRLQEPDIAYNFLIAGNGQTYEGRGWKYQAMVSGSNDNSTLVIAFLGIFNNSLPPEKQIDQAKGFLSVAENKGKLIQCYSILEKSNLKQAYDLFTNNVVLYLQQYFKKKHKHCQ